MRGLWDSIITSWNSVNDSWDFNASTSHVGFKRLTSAMRTFSRNIVRLKNNRSKMTEE